MPVSLTPRNAKSQPSRKGKNISLQTPWVIVVITSVVVASLVGLGWFFWSDSATPDAGETITQPKDNVVPRRAGQHETGQTKLPEARILEGGGKGTVTTVDNKQGGKRVSAQWVAVDAAGPKDGATLAPPADISKVGYYKASAPFGTMDKGSSVMTSHIDYAGTVGFGAVFLSLKQGDPVIVTDQEGKEFRYVVTSQPFTLDKNDPKYVDNVKNTINRTSGRNTLVLVTCGGRYIGGAQGYEDNIIVSARLEGEGDHAAPRKDNP